MALDKKSLAAAKRFTSDTADSLGAVKGAPATIKSITEVDGGQKVTFEWTGTSGTKQTSEMTVKNGVSVTGISDKGNGVFTLLLSDGSESDPIQTIKGQKGDKGDKLTFNDLTDEEKASLKGSDGFSPSAKIEKIGDTATITITDKDGTTTATIKDGQGGTGGGTADVPIEKIKVNGELQTPVNKVVDIIVPTVTNDLTDELKSSYDDAVTAKHTHDNGTVLDGITAEKVEAWDKAEENVQSDWNETDDTADGFIKNKPTIPDAYDDTALSGRVDDVETSIGDMSLIQVASVSDLVSAINSLYNAFMSGITYANKKLTITYRNGSSVDIDMSAIITDTKLTELSDVDDTGITDKQVLSYDSATSKYIPTTIDTAGVLADAKKYTDDEIKKINNADAIAVDEKPTYSEGTITYKKDGVESTITDVDYWFFYTVDDMAYQTIWIDGVEFTTSVDGSVDFNDFVSKTNDLTSTYTGEETDKTKVTTISALDALYAIISTALGKKVNTTDIVDSLSSDSTDKPLSAAQGKALDTKISDLVTTVEEDYAKKTDLHSHTNKTVLDGITEEKVTAWDKSQENIIESVKVNNQEITPDENKAVNIDLTGYAEHNEIVGENLIPYPYAQPERTTNGITFTFADDGSVIANGTATENADFSVCVRTNFGTDAALMLKPGIYAITGCPEGGSDSTYRIQVQFGDKTELKYSLKADYGKGFVFEVTEEYAQYACQIQCHVQKGYTVTDLVFKPMLVLGSVLKEYQPYKLSREALRTDIADVTELASRVDNQFSTASGDYITVTDSVDGNIVELGIKGNSFQQTYSGKNLAVYPYSDNTKAPYTTNGITYSVDNEWIVMNGTATSTAYFSVHKGSFLQGLQEGKTYTLSIEVQNGSASIYFATNNGSKNTDLVTITGVNNTTMSKSFIYTRTEDAIKDDFGIYTTASHGSHDNTKVRAWLEEGETATEYEPYVGGVPSPNPSYPQTINSVGDDGSLVVTSCGKNLIPYPYYRPSGFKYGGITFDILNDSSIHYYGTATTRIWYMLGNASNIKLKAGHKYLFSIDKLVGDKTYVYFIDRSTGTYKWYVLNYTRSKIVFTQNLDTIINIGIQVADGGTVDETVKIMLQECDDNGNPIGGANYEPYKGSTSTIPLSEPLRAIGDVKDEITYQDGKWGVLRRLRKVLIDGDTNKVALFNDTTLNLQRCTLVLNDIDKTYTNKADSAISNKFICNTYSKCKNGSLYVNTTGVCCIFDNNTFANVDEANNWFVSNNTVAIYRLATPVFEPFADQTLPYLSTYDGVTNISNDDALSAEMTVKYPTTDASRVGSRNESRIADIESAVGSTDISTIGDGTVTGAISVVNSNLSNVKITIDSELNSSSENTVQNKVITNAINGKQDVLLDTVSGVKAKFTLENGIICVREI